MENSKKIAIDLDGTLIDFVTPLVNHINREFGTTLMVGDITHYGFEDSPRIRQQIPISGWFWPFHDEFTKSGAYRDFELLPHAKEIIEYLKKRNHDIFILTSRDPDLGNLEQDTKICIERHFGEYFSQKIYFKPKGVTKAEVCRGLDFRVLIEDDLEHIIQATKYPEIIPILVDKPYNQTRESSKSKENGYIPIIEESDFYRIRDLSYLREFDKL